MNIGSNFSILFLSHILPSPKDTHKEVSGSHSNIVIYPVATPLWAKCEGEAYTPKSGNLESPGTPKGLEFELKG